MAFRTWLAQRAGKANGLPQETKGDDDSERTTWKDRLGQAIREQRLKKNDSAGQRRKKDRKEWVGKGDSEGVDEPCCC